MEITSASHAKANDTKLIKFTRIFAFIFQKKKEKKTGQAKTLATSYNRFNENRQAESLTLADLAACRDSAS